jgi:hypothetical protein
MNGAVGLMVKDCPEWTILKFGHFGVKLAPGHPFLRPFTPFKRPSDFYHKSIYSLIGRNVSHGPPLGSVSFDLSPMPTWLEQKPI